MNSKQRVKKTVSLEEPDRVPVDYWADKIVTEKLMSKLHIDIIEDLLLYLNIDFRFIEGSIYAGPRLKVFDDGSWTDIWGVRRKKIMVDSGNPDKGSYEHVVGNPLANAEAVKDIEHYTGWPSPEWFDYTGVEKSADRYSGFSVVCGGGRLNRTAQLKTAMYLRGVEQVMLDLVLNSEIVDAINERLVDFFIEYNKRIFKAAKGKIDIFFMGDDFGMQNGLIMSVEMWRRFYKLGFKKFIELAHSYGIKVMHHTCGAIEPLIPDFIECGLDILQSLQPRAIGMDLAKIKREYGRYICFQGGVDIQNTMPHGTAANVEREVMDRIKTLAHGGGYILCTAHNMQADTPVDNVLAFYKAAKKYGSY